MRGSGSSHEPEELGYGAWIVFWVQLAILALLALTGAFVASDRMPGDYTTGLTLAFASIVLGFLRIKTRFDGDPTGWSAFLLVDNWANLVLVTVVFVAIALIGIFVAAAQGSGSLYAAGIALAATSAVLIFLNLKNVFDNLDRQG